jgi:hypothetical protein
VSARILYLPGRSSLPGRSNLYETVVAAAGGRCECTGECGGKHVSGKGRCVHGHQRQRPLHAVPRDPTVTGPGAARLPVADLMAVCGGCFDGAASRAAADAASAPEVPEEQGFLFGGDPG